VAHFAIVDCHAEFNAVNYTTDPVHLALGLEHAMKNHPLEPGTFMQIEPIYHRFWWPDPLAYPLLWRKRVVAYRYFIEGCEVYP
jgi:hypothetical protein